MIDANRLSEIVSDCFFSDEELRHFQDNGIEGGCIPNAVAAQGIMNNFLFNPEKLEKHRAEITEMLLQLPNEFMKSKGGGMSFLQSCMDKHGNQWTGLHQTMDQLFTLGQAIGRAKCLLPREMWESLPGGMPYYVVEDAPA